MNKWISTPANNQHSSMHWTNVFVSIDNDKDKIKRKINRRSDLIQTIRLEFIGHESLYRFTIFPRSVFEWMLLYCSVHSVHAFGVACSWRKMKCHSNSHARQSRYKSLLGLWLWLNALNLVSIRDQINIVELNKI